MINLTPPFNDPYNTTTYKDVEKTQISLLSSDLSMKKGFNDITYNEEVYSHIRNEMSKRYEVFDQRQEVGFAQRAGVTGNIEFIGIKEIICILKHIKQDRKLLTECFELSANSQLFKKLYLMSNSKQGWNLRLHHYDLRGRGLGGEDSPHYHRWTLGSRIITGGYVNINYMEGDISLTHKKEYEYTKYSLEPTKEQVNKKARSVVRLGQATMTPIRRELYAKGDLRHFPIEKAHSVQTYSEFMGTTITLAHTGKAVKETSISYKKEDHLVMVPEERFEDIGLFEKELDKEVTYLQLLMLSDDLYCFLRDQQRDYNALTLFEEEHLRDYKEFNYVETSLLPALAIYHLEKENSIRHHEFSECTVNRFLDPRLAELDQEKLQEIINANQADLFDRQLTVEEEGLDGEFVGARALRKAALMFYK